MCVTVSMLTVTGFVIGSSPNCERESSALLLVPAIH